MCAYRCVRRRRAALLSCGALLRASVSCRGPRLDAGSVHCSRRIPPYCRLRTTLLQCPGRRTGVYNPTLRAAPRGGRRWRPTTAPRAACAWTPCCCAGRGATPPWPPWRAGTCSTETGARPTRRSRTPRPALTAHRPQHRGLSQAREARVPAVPHEEPRRVRTAVPGAAAVPARVAGR